MNPSRWRLARRVVQLISFVVFLGLVVYATGGFSSNTTAGLLLRFSPLAGLAAMLAERRWIAVFLPAVVLVGATLVLGRFWCGWFCPLGTLIDWTSPRKAAKRPTPVGWTGVKYGLLSVVLFAALWRNLTLLVLDPLTIFTRSVATVLWPGFIWLFNTAGIALYRVPFLRGPVATIDAALRGRVVSDVPAYYDGALLVAAFLVGILLLSRLARRAWCRYLCPLGGLLSLVSRASWLKRKVSPACVSCGACARECRMGTIDAQKGYNSDSGECILCMDCGAICPKEAISFGGERRVDRGYAYDPSRRQVLAALGVSLGGLALLKTGPQAHHPNPHLLRPPGAVEETLLAACIRCGACLRACPTHGLQPSLTEAGLEGLWTPILAPRLGHCEYTCTACGNICPTGAIPRVAERDKWIRPIGKAYIDPTLCIAWSGRGPCIVCEEMCPLPGKAIILDERRVTDAVGRQSTVQLPVVLPDRCIGCGLCESKCPIKGQAAIRVIVDPMS